MKRTYHEALLEEEQTGHVVAAVPDHMGPQLTTTAATEQATPEEKDHHAPSHQFQHRLIHGFGCDHAMKASPISGESNGIQATGQKQQQYESNVLLPVQTASACSVPMSIYTTNSLVSDAQESQKNGIIGVGAHAGPCTSMRNLQVLAPTGEGCSQYQQQSLMPSAKRPKLDTSSIDTQHVAHQMSMFTPSSQQAWPPVEVVTAGEQHMSAASAVHHVLPSASHVTSYSLPYPANQQQYYQHHMQRATPSCVLPGFSTLLGHVGQSISAAAAAAPSAVTVQQHQVIQPQQFYIQQQPSAAAMQTRPFYYDAPPGQAAAWIPGYAANGQPAMILQPMMPHHWTTQSYTTTTGAPIMLSSGVSEMQQAVPAAAPTTTATTTTTAAAAAVASSLPRTPSSSSSLDSGSRVKTPDSQPINNKPTRKSTSPPASRARADIIPASSSSDFDMSSLQPYFEMTEAEAAEKLGISTTKLKLLCRNGQVPRWPYRRLKGLQRKIEVMQNLLNAYDKGWIAPTPAPASASSSSSEDVFSALDQGGPEDLRRNISTLDRLKQYIKENPKIVSSYSTDEALFSFFLEHERKQLAGGGGVVATRGSPGAHHHG